MEEVTQESVEQSEVQEQEVSTETNEQPNLDEIREQIQQVKASEYDEDDQPQQEESESETDNEEETEDSEESEEGAKDDVLTIEIDGEEQEVSFDEVKNGYLRYSDYTKKTQSLAEERKEFDSKVEEMKPVMEEVEFWNKNPYLKEQIDQAVKEFQNTGFVPLEKVLDNSEQGQYINYLLHENTQLKDQIEQSNQKYQSVEFENNFKELTNDLKQEFGDLVDDELTQELRKQAEDEGLSIDVVKRIAKGELADKKIAKMNEENEKKTKQVEAETIKNIQKNNESTTGALGQEEGEHQVGFAQMTKSQQRDLIEKVKRGEIRNL